MAEENISRDKLSIHVLIIEFTIVFFYALILSLLSGFILLVSIEGEISNLSTNFLIFSFFSFELFLFLSNIPSVALKVTNIILSPLIKQIDAQNWKIFERLVDSIRLIVS